MKTLLRATIIITLQICTIATIAYMFITFVIMAIPSNAWLWFGITIIQILLLVICHSLRKSDKINRWVYQKEQRIEDKLRDIDFYLKRKFEDYEQ